MTNRFRLPPVVIELAEVDGDAPARAPKRIQIMRVGTFQTPSGAKVPITQDTLLSVKKNFDDRVRGIDLAVDLNHHEDHAAVGWFEALQIEGEGLWAEINWTPKGEKVLAEKEFRYFSPEFNFNYQDNETSERFGPTLLGGGLTNRPVIKGMQPAVELAESRGDTMDLTPEQIEEYKACKAKCDEMGVSMGEMVAQFEEMKGLKAANEELSEKVKTTEKKVTELTQELKEAKGAQALSEKEQKFNTMLSEGKVVEAQRAPYLQGDMAKFAELSGEVNLSERGSGKDKGGTEIGDGKDSKTPAQDKVLKLSEELQAKNPKLDPSAAISQVLSENAELSTAYRKEVALA